MRLLITLAVTMMFVPTLGAQQPSTPAAAAQAAPKPQAEAAPPEHYTYQVDGRRDPFMNLLGTGPVPLIPAKRPEGVAGLSVLDIAVRGVMQSRGALIAMVAGPDNRTYIVHQGDKLLDATIKTITADGLVMVQEVHDPLSLVKQREIRKGLHALEDTKE